jgi:tRNA(Ile)-lysidine synthetase-like protein
LTGSLNAITFNQLARPYQRRVIKRFLVDHDLSVDFQTIEELIDFIQGEGRHDQAVGLRSLEGGEAGKRRFLSLYKHHVSILDLPPEALSGPPAPDKPPVLGEGESPAPIIPVAVPGYLINTDLNMAVHLTPVPESERKKKNILRADLSQSIVVDIGYYAKRPLVLRTRQRGDRIHPFGMPVPMRLKNYLINKGIPRFERDRIPVVACGQEILWVLGYGISETLRVTERTGEEDYPPCLVRMERVGVPVPQETPPETQGEPEPSCP